MKKEARGLQQTFTYRVLIVVDWAKTKEPQRWLQLLSEIFRTELGGLLTQSESLNDGTVALDVVLLQIVEKGATLTYQLGEGSGSTIVFTVHLEVLRQMGNTVGEQCYLALSGTGVSVGLPVLSKDLLFFVR